MAETLSDSGHEVIVLTSAAGGNAKEFIHNGVKVLPFQLLNKYPGSWQGSEKEADRYRDVLLAEQPDLLISECWDAWTTILAKPLFMRLQCPKILVSHGYALHRKPKKAPPPYFGIGQWLLGIGWTIKNLLSLIKCYNRIVINIDTCDFGRFIDHTLARFLNPSAVRFLPNSPNLEMPQLAPREFRKKYALGRGPMVLCVANFSPRKNQELAIRCFYEAEVLDSTLVLIGSQPSDYLEKLMLLLPKYQLSHPRQRVLLLTEISREDTMEAYSNCDLFLLTAKEETMPFVLIESMAFSKPWIATGSGCIPKMEGGICVSSKEDLILSLRRLMFNAGESERLGGEGRKAYDAKYAPSIVKRRWMQLIAELSPQIS